MHKKIHTTEFFNERIKIAREKEIPVIVDWFSPEECGHYSVVVGFEKNKLLLADPHFGEIKKHSLSWFEERWFDMPFRLQGLILKQIIVVHRSRINTYTRHLFRGSAKFPDILTAS